MGTPESIRYVNVADAIRLVNKRALIKTTPTEDLDADKKLVAAAKEAKKVKGLAPSTVRASTW